MKNISIIILIILGSSFTYNAHAQQVERIVYWLHGLGGDKNGWKKVSEVTDFASTAPSVTGYPRRKIFSPELEYVLFQNTMDAASNSVKSSIENADGFSTAFNVTDKTKNFIIAHSMGGLVARDLDRKYALESPSGRRIGGIVTFGTPHQGARILNNKDMFVSFASGMCGELSAGFIEETIEKNFFFDLITSGASVRQLFIDNACTPLAQMVPKLFNDFTPGITEDFKVGATKLDQLNTFPSNIPKVAFWGKETAGSEMWRQLSSLLFQKPTDFSSFQAPDNQLLDFRNSGIQIYQTKVNTWQQAYDSRAYCSWTPWCWWYNNPLKDEARNIRDEYQRGLNWINNANEQWKVIIGAKRFEEVIVSGYECTCQDYDYDGNAIGSSWTNSVVDVNDCMGSSWMQSCNITGTTNVVTFNTIDEASDGVVVESSAKGFPKGASPLPTKTIEMQGSNHQQMRNDSNTKDRLLELFGGQHGSYFFTNQN